MSNFMNPEVVYGKFYFVETDTSLELYPADLFWYDLNDPINNDVTLKEGWFGRISASGYLDCTD